MARADPRDESSKFKRYREAQARRGMKLLRVWVPDPRSPDFQAAAASQAALLREAPEEAEALGFIAATSDWPEA